MEQSKEYTYRTSHIPENVNPQRFIYWFRNILISVFLISAQTILHSYGIKQGNSYVPNIYNTTFYKKS